MAVFGSATVFTMANSYPAPHSPNGKLSTDGLRQEEGCRLEDTAPDTETR